MTFSTLLIQALNKMEARQHADKRPQSDDTERENTTPTPDTQRNTEDEEDEEEKDEEVLLQTDEEEWSSEEQQTPSPTMQDTPGSHDLHCESTGDRCLCHPIEQQNGAEGAGSQEENCLSEEEDCGTCRPEELLQETVDRLKTVMETDRWRERPTGESVMWRETYHTEHMDDLP